jgi:hypothetical protein
MAFIMNSLILLRLSKMALLSVTYLESICALLQSSQLPVQFWPDALLTVSYTSNYAPCHGTAPFESWHNKPVNLQHLHVFGEYAYVRVAHPAYSKLSPRAQKMIFIGYCNNRSGFRFWDPLRSRVIESRDATFSGLNDEIFNRYSLGQIDSASSAQTLDFSTLFDNPPAAADPPPGNVLAVKLDPLPLPSAPIATQPDDAPVSSRTRSKTSDVFCNTALAVLSPLSPSTPPDQKALPACPS